MKRRVVSRSTAVLILAVLVIYALHLRFLPNKRYALVLYYAGENCAQNNCSLDKRISLAKQLIFHDPLESRSYSALAALYEAKKDEQAALELHRKAASLDENKDSYFWLGTYYFRHHDLASAFRYLNYMDRFTDRDPAVSYYLARIHEKLGNQDLASHYQRIAHEGGIDR